MGDRPVTVRIPVLENIATQFGGAFAQGESRYLNTQEKGIATAIFQQSINLDPVRLVVTTVVSAPTTLGNNIRIPPGWDMPNHTLIHELTHVWQYQTRGSSCISNSFIHQAAGILSGASRDAAYHPVIVQGQSIYRYTAEHQAVIVEDYYWKPALQLDPDYQRMIAEVRSAKPVFTSMDSYQESLYGPGYQNRRATDGLLDRNDRRGGTVPIFRLEW